MCHCLPPRGRSRRRRPAHNVGRVLKALGDLPAARTAYERALVIFERVYGPDHPRTRIVRGNLEGLDEEEAAG